MTKQEAIKLMEQDKKVAHRFFEPYEWITMLAGKIVTEEGYCVSANQFWSYRQDKFWEEDWSIVE
jgi:hypothetical protein